jgi:hypothetical protein
LAQAKTRVTRVSGGIDLAGHGALAIRFAGNTARQYRL